MEDITFEDITFERPACEHDYVLVSCFGSVSGLPGSVDVRARCERCEHEVEIKGAQMTRIDYGPDPEGVVTTDCDFVELELEVP